MHKSGFVNIVGNPNVGKSTLMNLLVGERISIATFKAQTTRHRIMGIINDDDAQIVFSDTPGVLKPNYKLQESMLAFSESALVDADVLLYVTDPMEKIDKKLRKTIVLYQTEHSKAREKIRQLPEGQCRRFLMDYYIEGKSWDEIFIEYGFREISSPYHLQTRAIKMYEDGHCMDNK